MTIDNKRRVLRQVPFTDLDNQMIRNPNVSQLLSFVDKLPFAIRKEDESIDYIKTTAMMEDLMVKDLIKTPLYHYELMEGMSGTKNTWLKHENIQRLGDTTIRAFCSIIYGNALIQGKEGKPKSISIGLCSTNYSSSRYLSDIVFAASEMGIEVNIFCSPLQMCLYDLHNLFLCKSAGAKLHWVVAPSDSVPCSVPCPDCSVCQFIMHSASEYAKNNDGVFINPVNDRPLAILGISTAAHEIFEQRPETETIVVPYRNRTTGWSTLAGISLYCAMLTREHINTHAKPIRVVAANMIGDTVVYDERGNKFRSTESSFNDYRADLYLRNKTPMADPEVCFENWCTEERGVLHANDLIKILDTLGAPLKEQLNALNGKGEKNFVITDKASESLAVAEICDEKLSAMIGIPSESDFFLYHNLHLRDIPATDSPLTLDAFKAHLDCQRMVREWNGSRAYSDLTCQVELNALKYHGLIHEIVAVNDEEVSSAFMDCLSYTHTHVSGRGAASLAALFSDKIKFEKDECAVALLPGGTVEIRDFTDQLEKGLELQGQLHKVKVTLPDNSKTLNELLDIISKNACSVFDLNIDHNGSQHVAADITVEFFAPSRNAIYQVQSSFVSRKWEVSPMIDEPAPLVSNDPVASTVHGEALQYETAINSLEEITPESIKQAYHRLTDNGILNKTPIYRSAIYSKEAGCNVYLMLENLQKTGSFKCRGASNMLLKAIETSKEKGLPPPAGVIACSAGNAGFGTAHAAQKLGIPCTIVCPSYAPKTKVDKIRQCGAEVILHGTFEDAAALSRKLCTERGWLLIHPYDAYDVVEGQGTIGYEIDEALPDLDTIMVNVGGGGMITGIATYLRKIRAARGQKPIRVIGIQAESVSPLVKIKETGKLRFIDPHAQTIADGVNVKVPGSARLDPALFGLVDEWVAIPENQIAATITHMMSTTRTLVEGAGCLGIAAILYNLVKFTPNEKVGVIICGGSVDLNRLAQLNEFGLRALGRTLTIEATIEDKAGQLAQIVKIAQECNSTVRQIQHHRYADDVVWTSTIVQLSLWVTSFESQVQFLTRLVKECHIHPKIIGRSQVPFADDHYAVAERAIAIDKNEHLVQVQTAQASFDEVEAKKRRK